MKKTYMRPETMAVAISTVGMIAASDPNTVTATVSDETVTSGWADSKGGFTLWNDDEDED